MFPSRSQYPDSEAFEEALLRSLEEWSVRINASLNALEEEIQNLKQQLKETNRG